MTRLYVEELAGCARTHAIADAYDGTRLVYLRETIDAVREHPLIPADFQTRIFTGDVLRLNVREEVGRFLFLFKAYEIGLTRFLCDYLRGGMTAFDVGAHIGYFSVVMARLVGESGTVVAFEPTPSTVTYLRENVHAMPWVHIEQVLVGERMQLASFNDYGEGHSAFNSLTSARTSDGSLLPAACLKIPMVSLDDYCRNRAVRPDLIKIDVESAESRVLSGMCDLLTEDPVIILEVGDFDHLAEEIPSSGELLERMCASGFRLFEPLANGLVPHRVRTDAYSYGNIVCVPKAKLADVASRLLSSGLK